MKRYTLDIKSKVADYQVKIGNNILTQLPGAIKKISNPALVCAVIDSEVKRLHWVTISEILNDNFQKVIFHTVPQGERSKSSEQLNKIYSFLLKNKCDKHTVMLAIGGGVTGDIAGLAASTYLRGIKLVHIPTTLLSMVDSCIGGKTAINFNDAKNIIGTIYPPQLVFIETDFLKTLPDVEIKAAFGEIIKYAFIADESYYNYLKKNINLLLSGKLSGYTELIYRCLQIKKAVVEADEYEAGIRQILNFGHTFGHAIESGLEFKVKHGYAIAAGIIAAIILSREVGLITKQNAEKFFSLPLKIHIPKEILALKIPAALSFIDYDKKRRDGKYRFILISDIREIVTGVNPDRKLIKSALEEMLEVIKVLNKVY